MEIETLMYKNLARIVFRDEETWTMMHDNVDEIENKQWLRKNDKCIINLFGVDIFFYKDVERTIKLDKEPARSLWNYLKYIGFQRVYNGNLLYEVFETLSYEGRNKFNDKLNTLVEKSIEKSIDSPLENTKIAIEMSSKMANRVKSWRDVYIENYHDIENHKTKLHVDEE
jgi:hypothetical protein